MNYDERTTRAFDTLKEQMRTRSLPNEGERRVLLQDCLAQRTQEELTAFYEGLDDSERRLFTWMAFNLLDPDLAVSIWQGVVGKKLLQEKWARCRAQLDEISQEIDAGWDKLTAVSRKHQEFRRGYWKRLRETEEERDRLRFHNNFLREENRSENKRAQALSQENRKLREELKKHQALSEAIRALQG